MALTKLRQRQVESLPEVLSMIKQQIKTFKEPISLLANMPLSNNNDGDLRVCLEDGKVYVWRSLESKWILSSGLTGTYGKIVNITISENNQTIIKTNITFDDNTADLQTNNTSINLYLNGILMGSNCYTSENVENKLVITWLENDNYPLCINDQVGIQYYDTLGGQKSTGGNNSGGNSNINLTSVSTDIIPSQSGSFSIGSEQLPFKTVYANNAKILSNFLEVNVNQSTYTQTGIKINRGKLNPYMLVFDETDDELKFGEQNSLNAIANKGWTEQKITEKLNSFVINENDLSEEELTQIINEIIGS